MSSWMMIFARLTVISEANAADETRGGKDMPVGGSLTTHFAQGGHDCHGAWASLAGEGYAPPGRTALPIGAG